MDMGGVESQPGGVRRRGADQGSPLEQEHEELVRKQAVDLDDDASTVAGNARVLEDADEPGETVVQPDPWKDMGALLLLLALYTLQGIPMGLAHGIPILLQSKGFGFGAKAIFSLAPWPYSLKLLWSPVVDAVYSDRVGRRKSWVVPVQILTGIVMVLLGSAVDKELATDTTPDVWRLTTAFLFLYFLVATQDIAVDGWALTMLRPENVGYASVCNSIGQTTGYITSYALMLAFGDGDFCDKYLRSPDEQNGQPLVTLGQFMLFWGIIFILVTLGLALFKSEQPDPSVMTSHNFTAAAKAVSKAYKAGWKVLLLPNVQQLLVILVTSRVAFATIDSALDLELLQKGVEKQMILLIGLIYTPFEIAFSVLASRWTAGDRPLGVWANVYPARIAICMCLLLLVGQSPDVAPGVHSSHSWLWYGLVITAFVGIRLCSNVMFVSQMAFYNRIADPAIGGTYMTMLNTVTNLGGMWPGPLVLMAIEFLEQTGCYVGEGAHALQNEVRSLYLFNDVSNTELRTLPPADDGNPLTCRTAQGAAVCAGMGGHCTHRADGFLIMGLLCAAIGMVWIAWFHPVVHRVQDLPPDGWKVAKRDLDD